jgi:hypothetical protein
MSPYITSLDEISSVLKKRKDAKTAIRARTDEAIYAQYGIRDFSATLRRGILEPLGIDPQEADQKGQSFGMLARQIPGICAEDIACHCLAQRAQLRPLSMAFTRDAFIVGGNDKIRRAKVPFVSWSKKGSLQLANTVVVESDDNTLNALNMVRIDRINTKPEFGGLPLAEYHRSMHSTLFGRFSQPGLWGDISSLYGSFLAESIESGRVPNPVWKTGDKGRDEAFEGALSSEDARTLIIRPSSKWYYELYLSMFLDGTFVLMETYDNEEGGVPLVKELFERSVSMVRSRTGVTPVVLKTTSLRRDMLYVNQTMLDDPERAAAFMEGQKYWENDTARMTRWLAERAIQFA